MWSDRPGSVARVPQPEGPHPLPEIGPAPRFRGERLFIIVAGPASTQQQVQRATVRIAHRLDAQSASTEELSLALRTYASRCGREARLVMHTRGRIVFVVRRPAG
jgi:hypothetical protein